MCTLQSTNNGVSYSVGTTNRFSLLQSRTSVQGRPGLGFVTPKVASNVVEAVCKQLHVKTRGPRSPSNKKRDAIRKAQLAVVTCNVPSRTEVAVSRSLATSAATFANSVGVLVEAQDTKKNNKKLEFVFDFAEFDDPVVEGPDNTVSFQCHRAREADRKISLAKMQEKLSGTRDRVSSVADFNFIRARSLSSLRYIADIDMSFFRLVLLFKLLSKFEYSFDERSSVFSEITELLFTKCSSVLHSCICELYCDL